MTRRVIRQLWFSRSRYLLTFLAIVMGVAFVNATLTLTESIGAGDEATVKEGEAGPRILFRPRRIYSRTRLPP